MNTVLISEWVSLAGGVDVPVSAVLLAIRLADAGWTMTRLGDRLHLQPVGQPGDLSAEDRAAITALKPYLLTISAYLTRF